MYRDWPVKRFQEEIFKKKIVKWKRSSDAGVSLNIIRCSFRDGCSKGLRHYTGGSAKSCLYKAYLLGLAAIKIGKEQMLLIES